MRSGGRFRDANYSSSLEPVRRHMCDEQIKLKAELRSCVKIEVAVLGSRPK